MAVLKSIKDVVVGQAFKLAGSPRVSKLVSDPRLMNAAMKAMSVGGAVKTNLDKAGRLAAGAFGSGDPRRGGHPALAPSSTSKTKS